MKVRSLLPIGALSSALLFLLFTAPAFADCHDGPPQILSITKGSDNKTVVIKYVDQHAFSGCAWPADFYQLRWTQGEGPGTQGQSAQLKGIPLGGEFNLVFDTTKLWGFVLESCYNKTLAPSACSSWSPMKFYKPFGPYMCHTPYVWRNAFPNDFVCVTPQTSQEAAADDAAAASRLSPDHVNCIYGFVWRGAIPSDHVCVTPSTRQQVADDNAQAAARQLP